MGLLAPVTPPDQAKVVPAVVELAVNVIEVLVQVKVPGAAILKLGGVPPEVIVVVAEAVQLFASVTVT